MYIITGDTHGDFSRVEEICKEYNTVKDDVLIVLGDAGLNYYCDSRDKKRKEYLKNMPITIFCIHGNHEARPQTISTYKEKLWKWGSVYYEEEYPNILFAKDGEVYDFNGNSVLVVGGAYSVDKFHRLLRGFKWWEDEQPSDETKKHVEEELDKRNWTVDYILTHTVPVKYEPVEVFLPMIDQSTVDKSTEEWLDTIEEKLQYKKWYAGHYHTKKIIDKLELMFENYHLLEGE